MSERPVEREQLFGYERTLPTVARRRFVGTLLGLLRLALGWIFFWAFLDKLIGLGFATCRQDDGSVEIGCQAAMIQGGSPTYGFLANATQDSVLGFAFRWLAPPDPNTINLVDVIFMAALLFIGVALGLGILMWIASVGAALLLLMMYAAGFMWPENNPFIDDHIIYAVLLILLASAGAGRWLGLNDRWNTLRFVQRNPWLR